MFYLLKNSAEFLGAFTSRSYAEKASDLPYSALVIVLDGVNSSLDFYLDTHQKKLGEEHNQFIIDSRLGFRFIPSSFRVSVLCFLPIAAQRAHAKRKTQPNYATLQQAERTIAQRLAVEQKNFQEKYSIPDYCDPFHFDFVFDNSCCTPEQAAALILAKYHEYLQRTEEIKRIAHGFDALEGNEVDYLSSPISEGQFLYAFLEEKKISFSEELKKIPEFVERVIKPNKDKARHVAEEWTQKNRRAVIVPATFHLAGWSERDYLDLWIPVIEAKAKRVFFVEGWQYSGGCVEEFLVAQQRKIPCFEQQGIALTTEKARELISKAVQELELRKVSNSKLKELYRRTQIIDSNSCIRRI